jgi:hypothetical protein
MTGNPFRFVVETRVLIAAPPEAVWRVLTDLERWSEWNAMVRYEGGRLAVGERLALRLTPPSGTGYAFRPTVTALDPPRRFAWIGRTGGVPGIFDGAHSYTLRPVGAGTELVDREVYSGLLAPVVERTAAMRDAPTGFAEWDRSLKRRVEDGAAGSPP